MVPNPTINLPEGSELGASHSNNQSEIKAFPDLRSHSDDSRGRDPSFDNDLEKEMEINYVSQKNIQDAEILWRYLTFETDLYVTSRYELNVRHKLTSYTNLKTTPNHHTPVAAQTGATTRTTKPKEVHKSLRLVGKEEGLYDLGFMRNHRPHGFLGGCLQSGCRPDDSRMGC
jgi:hypothetical protein